jgi:hypothetical protein
MQRRESRRKKTAAKKGRRTEDNRGIGAVFNRQSNPTPLVQHFY